MTRAPATTPKRRRKRERLAQLAVVLVAAISGLVAAHFGTPRVWENTHASSPSTTASSVPFVDPQRTP